MTLKGPTGWVHLSPLLEGYLHQDFTTEHGSADRAVAAFLAEAHPQDLIKVSSEWRSFLNLTYGLTSEQRAHVLRGSAGGAWAPADAEEFDRVSALLLDAGRR